MAAASRRDGLTFGPALMSSLLNLHAVWPRVAKAGLGVSTLALLFYGSSLYTRDWRAAVPDMGRPAQARAASRPKAALELAASKPMDSSALVEPATTGTLPRIAEAAAEPVAEPRTGQRSTRAVDSAPSRARPKPPPSRSPVQHKPNKQQTLVAAGSGVRPASVELSTGQPERPVQSRLTEPVQFRLADRSN